MSRRLAIVLFVLALAIGSAQVGLAAYTVSVADLTAYSSPQMWSINNFGQTAGRVSDAGVYRAYT
jgi:hypothetical protein